MIFVALLPELGEVFPHVVVIVAVVVQLEQAGYVFVTGLIGVWFVWVKEVLQGFGTTCQISAPGREYAFTEILDACPLVGISIEVSTEICFLRSGQQVIPDQFIIPISRTFRQTVFCRIKVYLRVAVVQDLFYDPLHAGVGVSVLGAFTASLVP